jgi:hypothetical protein
MTGQTGTGKSMCALAFADLIDPNFSADRVVFTVKDFLELLKTLPKGAVVVFDEAGVDFDARRSSSNKNIFFSNVLKTFRYRNIPTIFTLPHLAMLDKNARRLFHFWVKTRSIDYEREICWTSFYVINSEDDWSDTIKRFMVRVRDPKAKEKRKIAKVGFKKPRKDLVDEYEQKKHEYVQAMLKDMQKRMDKKDKEDGSSGGDDDYEPSMKELLDGNGDDHHDKETIKNYSDDTPVEPKQPKKPSVKGFEDLIID